MRPIIRVLWLCAALSACIPARARAETYISPWAGVVFGNDRAASGFRSFGVVFGSASSDELAGSETSIGFTNGFFGKKPGNYVADVMTGITIGPTFSGPAEVRVRPYFGVGIGTMRVSISSGVSGVDRSARNGLAFDYGAGAMFDFTAAVGLRADVRYYRAFSGKSKDNSLNVDLAHFHFWQATIGLVIWRG